MLTIFFSYSLTQDPTGVTISKCYSYPSYQSQRKVFKLVLNFPPDTPNKTTLEILTFWVSVFLAIFFSKLSIHHCILCRNQKLQLSGERAIVARNGVKLGARRQYIVHIKEYLWPCSVQGHFGVIWWTCDFSDNAISSTLFFPTIFFRNLSNLSTVIFSMV